MLKKIIFVCILLLISAVYFIGAYFVDYALKRSDNNSPAADEHLHNPATAVEIPNVEHEVWTITSQDGLKLNASHLMPNQNLHRWAILVHGYGCDQKYSWDYAPEYLKNDFDVITPDLRTSGTSEGIYER